jgi:hypothetical protein
MKLKIKVILQFTHHTHSYDMNTMNKTMHAIYHGQDDTSIKQPTKCYSLVCDTLVWIGVAIPRTSGKIFMDMLLAANKKTILHVAVMK